MISLDTSETLAKILGALSPGHRLRRLALEFTGPAEGLLQAGGGAGRARDAAGWPGEFGALAAPGDPRAGRDSKPRDLYLLWLGPCRGTSASPTASKPALRRGQFVLYPPQGSYRIEYWTTGNCRLTGVEIGSSSPLVLSPPGDGPYLVLIRRLA